MADLFTLSELASYLQRDLDTSSATLAQATGQGIVRGYVRQEITSTTYTAAILPITVEGSTWVVRFPQRPVTAVSSVAVNGTTYTLGTDWAWNGYAPYIRLATVVASTATFSDDPTATVTYTAGFATVPPDIKAVALAVAGRQYDNPTGVRSWAVDDASETKGGTDDDIAGVTLLSAEKTILDRYRVRAGSVVVR